VWQVSLDSLADFEAALTAEAQAEAAQAGTSAGEVKRTTRVPRGEVARLALHCFHVFFVLSLYFFFLRTSVLILLAYAHSVGRALRAAETATTTTPSFSGR
jgi:hypothetical protein